MIGAALLAGRAALHLGAGRVYLGLLADPAPTVDLVQPELMLRTPDAVFDLATALAVGPGLGDVAVETIEIPACDQYGVMGDAFAAAVQDGTPQPVPLENSLANMKVIDAVFRAAANGSWERP